MKKTLAVAGLGAALIAVVALAPTANATSGDAGYLDWLDSYRVHYRSSSTVISIAHSVCDTVAASPTQSTVTQARMSAKDAGFDATESAAIVVGSIHFYCPSYEALIS